MRKYFKVAAFSAFFCGSLCLAQTASKSMRSVGFEFEQDAVQNGEGSQSKYSVYYFR
jgi:hypothetical protein